MSEELFGQPDIVYCSVTMSHFTTRNVDSTISPRDCYIREHARFNCLI